MSKLIKIKKIFTLEETVSYLSTFCEEPILLSDIYELILSGDLTLSIRFINPAYGLKGRIISGVDGEKYQLNTDLVTGAVLDKLYIGYIDDNAVPVEDDTWFVYDKRVHLVDGIWDLPMIGIERLEIERLYSKNLNLPDPLYTGNYGLYLKRNEVICRLQNESLQNCHDENNEGTLILNSVEDVLNEFSQSDCFNRRNYDDSMRFSEHDFQFIIKATEISRFIRKLQEEETQLSDLKNEKSLSAKERNTYLKLITALCLELKIDPEARGAATPIEKITQLHGNTLSNETIRQILIKINN